MREWAHGEGYRHKRKWWMEGCLYEWAHRNGKMEGRKKEWWKNGIGELLCSAT